MTAVGVISGAGSLGGYHRGAERGLRRALVAERGALVGLLQPLEDLPADAHRRFLRFQIVHLENVLGVVVPVLVAQPEAAPGDQADPAPFAVADLEHLLDQLPRRGVALASHRPAVLILHLRTA